MTPWVWLVVGFALTALPGLLLLLAYALASIPTRAERRFRTRIRTYDGDAALRWYGEITEALLSGSWKR